MRKRSALGIVPAFLIFIGCREHAKARKLEADRAAGRKREAEAERNREIGERVYELRQAGMEYEDIFKRLKAEGPDLDRGFAPRSPGQARLN